MNHKVILISKLSSDQNIISQAILSDGKFEIIAKGISGKDAISFVKRLNPKLLVLSTTIDDMTIESVVNKILQVNPIAMMIIHSDDRKIPNKLKIMQYGLIDWFSTTRKNQKLNISEIGLVTRCHILAKIKTYKFQEQINYVNKSYSVVSKISDRLSQKRKNIEKLITKSTTPIKIKEKKAPLKIKSDITTNTEYGGTGRINKIIVIGTSTGGPKLLNEIVPKFPPNLPPVLLIQHMPVGFTKAFAERLNRLSKISVKQAEDGEIIHPGMVYIAPGGFHLELQNRFDGYPLIVLNDGKPVNFVKPAVDATLISALNIYGSGVISVILTGMGSDGKKGSIQVKKLGGKVLALDEKDSDIYGMNKSVIESDIVDLVLRKRDFVSGIIRTLENKL